MGKLFKKILIMVAVLVFSLDGLMVHRHSHFAESGVYSMDAFPVFYGVLAIVVSFVTWGLSRAIGRVIRQKETYYDHDF
jgi:hypothetical protein